MSSVVKISAFKPVNLYVADPEAVAGWYGRVLSLQVLPSSKLLHVGKYVATPSGEYCATIFPGKPPSDGDNTTAFRVPGRVFMEFGKQLPHSDVAGRSGNPLHTDEATDHDLAFSYYFQDPYGNHLELTNYDHETARRWLETKERTHA